MELANKSLTTISIPGNKLININEKVVGGEKPQIGITYLDSKDFSLDHLIKCNKSGGRPVKELKSFLEKARTYESLSELVDNHKSHNSGLKNDDKKSLEKIKQIETDYRIEAGEMIHLHTQLKGNGKFVLHGFTVKNIFEIVWLDCNHELHDSK